MSNDTKVNFYDDLRKVEENPGLYSKKPEYIEIFLVNWLLGFKHYDKELFNLVRERDVKSWHEAARLVRDLRAAIEERFGN